MHIFDLVVAFLDLMYSDFVTIYFFIFVIFIFENDIYDVVDLLRSVCVNRI